MDAFQKCLDSKDEVIQKCEAVNDTLHQQLLETENNLKTLTSEHEKTKIELNIEKDKTFQYYLKNELSALNNQKQFSECLKSKQASEVAYKAKLEEKDKIIAEFESELKLLNKKSNMQQERIDFCVTNVEEFDERIRKVEHKAVFFYPSLREEIEEEIEEDFEVEEKDLDPKLIEKISNLFDFKENERLRNIQAKEKIAKKQFKTDILIGIFFCSIFFFLMIENTFSFVYWFY